MSAQGVPPRMCSGKIMTYASSHTLDGVSLVNSICRVWSSIAVSPANSSLVPSARSEYPTTPLIYRGPP